MKIYDFVVIGGGISGTSVSYFLSQHNKNSLLIDRFDDVALGASGAAGGFLSPNIAKPNNFEDLVRRSLDFSLNFYKENFPNLITTKGTLRVDLNEFFPFGSTVDTIKISKELSKNIDKKFGYEVKNISYKKELWVINNSIKTKNLILTTGADMEIIKEKYLGIRPVWGQRIDASTSTFLPHNFHKKCSISASKGTTVKIGATHKRFENEPYPYSLKQNHYSQKIIKTETEELLKNAMDIVELKDLEILNHKVGARASSIDYFPIVGKLVDSKESIKKYPSLANGEKISDDELSYYNNLYILNGVGGRGFVFAPFLAKQLVENIFSNTEIEESVKSSRLFTKWVRKP